MSGKKLFEGVDLSGFGEIVKQIRHVDQRGPIILDVLACREMAIALVVFARRLGERAHLLRRQRAVGDRNTQHIGVELQIEPVHQP